MKKLFALLLICSQALAGPVAPVIWGPGNKATVIPPVLVVGSIQYGGTSAAPATTTWTSPTSVTGTVTNSALGTAVTGTGTKFLTEFRSGDTITAGGETRTIAAITSDTALTTDAWTGANTGAVATRTANPVAFLYPGGAFQVGGTRLSWPINASANTLFMGVTTAPSAAATSVPSAQFSLYAYSGSASATSGPNIRMGRARGVEALPVAIASGDALGNLTFQGFGATSFGNGAQVHGEATETWSSSARGSKIILRTTPNTTTTLTDVLTLDQDKSATFAGDITMSGAGTNPGVFKVRNTATAVPITGTGGGTTGGGTAAFTLATNGDGLVLVYNSTTGAICLGVISGGFGTFTIVSDPSSKFSTTATTASKDNITLSASNTLTIEHNSQTSTANNFRVTQIGTN